MDNSINSGQASQGTSSHTEEWASQKVKCLVCHHDSLYANEVMHTHYGVICRDACSDDLNSYLCDKHNDWAQADSECGPYDSTPTPEEREAEVIKYFAQGQDVTPPAPKKYYPVEDDDSDDLPF